MVTFFLKIACLMQYYPQLNIKMPMSCTTYIDWKHTQTFIHEKKSLRDHYIHFGRMVRNPRHYRCLQRYMFFKTCCKSSAI